jgi:phage FluMu protein Com
MSDHDIVPLDGNAAAGPLMDVFGVDMTGATVKCESCGRESALATLALYGGAVGLVLRCPRCDAVNLRVSNTGRSIHIDLRGASRISIHLVP